MQHKLDRDMHLLLDDLEMPANQSMTLSSLSQSQWQGRSTRSYLSNISPINAAHHHSHESSQQPSARGHPDSSSSREQQLSIGEEEK
jgi:hypothetical protein